MARRPRARWLAGVESVACAVPHRRDAAAMILARSPKTAWRVIEGEAVILSLDTKAFRGLNPVGSRVWELIDGQRSVEDIVEVIVREFDITPQRAADDVQTFVRELLDKELLIRGG